MGGNTLCVNAVPSSVSGGEYSIALRSSKDIAFCVCTPGTGGMRMTKVKNCFDSRHVRLGPSVRNKFSTGVGSFR